MEAKTVMERAARLYGQPANGAAHSFLGPLKIKARRAYWSLLHRMEKTSDWDGLFFHDDFGRTVMFSFDDGPREEHTLAVARMLDKHGVRGTFFMEGWRMLAFPEIVRAIDDAGHFIGNHTFSHRLEPPSFTSAHIADEMLRTERALNHVLADRYPRGYPHKLFRPPEGYPWSRSGTAAARRQLMDVVCGLGYKIILWHIDSRDWMWPGDPHLISNMCVRQIHSGANGVFLFHDTHPALAPALEYVIDYCRENQIEIADPFAMQRLAARRSAP